MVLLRLSNNANSSGLIPEGDPAKIIMGALFMKINTGILILFLIAICFPSCDTGESIVDDAGPEPNVYVAGQHNLKACYWIDGVKKDLLMPGGVTVTESVARHIFVSDDMVYVVGSYRDDDYKEYYCYWKGDFSPVTLEGPEEAYYYYITGMTVHNGSIYISGYCYISSFSYRAFYWKDGARVDLNHPDTELEARANAITVAADGSVYVAGRYGDDPCYWKGTAARTVLQHPVDDTGHFAMPSLIAVSDSGVVHVVGGSYLKMYRWKGTGEPIELPSPDDATSTSLYTAYINIYGEKVYIAGSYTRNTEKACYWVDGTRIDMSGSQLLYPEVSNIILLENSVYMGFHCMILGSGGFNCGYWKDGNPKVTGSLPASGNFYDIFIAIK